ncbi:tyrosine-type recombinase/integrase [Streptomyces sp. NPDC007896]|uniref:tyrosine-type recombinase/integrase n=1 Tax=Streptomyces sp. NPDC007896 TaxID=3364784 RepID=UPI0036EC0F77
MRKGEALGVRWDDVPLDERVILIRYTLSAVDNDHLVLTTPKTKTSWNRVALSDRVATALGHRARARGPVTNTAAHGGYVFHRPDGRPLHPEYVLNHFRYLSRQAGVPRITVHGLRHLAATLSRELTGITDESVSAGTDNTTIPNGITPGQGRQKHLQRTHGIYHAPGAHRRCAG